MFKQAVRKKVKLRLGLAGPSGSGKTFSALSIASGMSDKIAVIDSEYDSSLLYADKFKFDQDNLTSFDPLHYVEKINDAARAGFEVLVVDSATHAWQFILDYNQKIADRKFKGNTYAAWSETTPKLYKPFISAILSYPGHVIITFRSKTETAMEKDKEGKNVVTKLGTKIEQKDTIEYEMTVMLQLDMNNVALCTKSRIDNLLGKYFEKPGIELGKYLLTDLNQGDGEQSHIDYVSSPDALINSEMSPAKKASTTPLDYGQPKKEEKKEPVAGTEPKISETLRKNNQEVIERVNTAIAYAKANRDLGRLQKVTFPNVVDCLNKHKIDKNTYDQCDLLITKAVSEIALAMMNQDQELTTSAPLDKESGQAGIAA